MGEQETSTVGWIKSAAKRLTAGGLGLLAAALISQAVAEARETNVNLVVAVDGAESLKSLPRDGNPSLTATVTNDGADTASNIRVRLGESHCGDIGSLAPTATANVTCPLDGKVTDAEGNIKVIATDGAHSAETEVSVKWAEAQCPSYSAAIEASKNGTIGVGTLEEVATRWNSAIELMDAPGCDMEMARFTIDPSTPRAKFSATNDEPASAGSYIADFDKTRQDVVTELKINLSETSVVDTAHVLRLIAAVSATNADDAAAVASPAVGDDAATSTTSIASADGSTVIVACGKPFTGVEVTARDIGTTRQLTVGVCSTRG